MRKIYVIIFSGSMIFFSACATVFNTKRQTINIIADKSVKDFKVQSAYLLDSAQGVATLTKKYSVERSPNPLVVELKTGDTACRHFVQAKHSSAYWWNIPTTYGIGLLVDRYSNKRFSYSSDYYLSANDSVAVYRKNSSEFYKGQIFIRPTYHIMNEVTTSFNKNEYDATGALLGIGIGADFFINSHKYISADVGTATSKVLCDYCKVPDTINRVSYISIRQNHIVGKFDLGYGINMSVFSKEFVDTISNGYTSHNGSLGLSFFAQYRISPHFGIGILLQPGIYTFTKKYAGFASQGYASFNLNFMIPVKQ